MQTQQEVRAKAIELVLEMIKDSKDNYDVLTIIKIAKEMEAYIGTGLPTYIPSYPPTFTPHFTTVTPQTSDPHPLTTWYGVCNCNNANVRCDCHSSGC